MAQYGYTRCSTSKSKQDVERQRRELIAQGVETIVEEYASGATVRPVFEQLFNQLKKGDTLAVTEVSRLSRSLHQLCHVADDAQARGIKLVCGSLVLDFPNGVDPMYMAMFQIMGVFAELERALTVERVRSGVKNAKANGTRMGRPKVTAEGIPDQVKSLYPIYKAGKLTKADYARQAGISRTVLYKYLRLMGEVIDPDKTLKITDIPQVVHELLPKYQAGEINKVEYARQAGISRPALDKYLKMLQG